MLDYDDYQKIKELKQTHPSHYELLQKVIAYALDASSIGCHDIKNHAGIISSYCQLIEMNNPEFLENPYFNKINSNTNKLLNLLDNIAAFRYSFDNTDIKNCSVLEMLDKAIEVTKTKYHNTDYEIIDHASLNPSDTNLPPSSGVNICCHKEHLVTAFSAILLNAAESCESKDFNADKNVKIYISVEENKVCINFVDNGIGFDDTMKPKAFQPFTTDKKNHVGLGLATAANIIWQHGGNISITEKDSNTCVSVILPFEPE